MTDVFIKWIWGRMVNTCRLNPYSAEAKDFWKPSKPYHIGIHWIVLTENTQMSTQLPGFQPFFKGFLDHFVLAKVATSLIRVKSSSLILLTLIWKLTHSSL